MKTTENTVIENNKLILEFMGAKYNPIQNRYEDIPIPNSNSVTNWHIDLVCYHSSWAWLMHVVFKIREIDQKSKGDFKQKILHYKRNNKTIFGLSILEGKEYVYSSVIDFIKWYNENNQ